jgi:hypothetical protein
MLTEIKRTARTAGEAYRIIAGGAALGGTSDTTLKGAWELPNGTEIDGASLARITKSPRPGTARTSCEPSPFTRIAESRSPSPCAPKRRAEKGATKMTRKATATKLNNYARGQEIRYLVHNAAGQAWDGENFLRALPLYEDSRIEITITLRP